MAMRAMAERAMNSPTSLAMTKRDSRDIIRRLQREGWILKSVRGSHHTFKHVAIRQLVTVPHPKSDIAIGTALNIARMARWRDKGPKEPS